MAQRGSFGGWLKAQRLKREWSQQKLANALAYERVTIVRLESSLYPPLRSTVAQIDQLFGPVPDYVLESLHQPVKKSTRLARELRSSLGR